MEPEEKEICEYLKTLRGQFISPREISRRAAGKRRFHEDPNWAASFLAQLLEKKVVESNAMGHYRLIIKNDQKGRKRWVSPQMKSILEKSGKDFTHIIPEEDIPPE